MKAADCSPQEFVKLLLPFLTTVLENNVDKRLGQPWRDSIWGYNISASNVGLHDSLLVGMEGALSWLARNDPNEFDVYAADLRKSDYLIHQYLLVRSYAADGQRYADEAARYLIEDFSVRLVVDDMTISPETPVCRLLRKITPSCSTDNLARLEQLILDHYPEWERGWEGRRRRGASQLRLLASIDGSRISERAARRLQEHRRKFEDALGPETMGIRGGYVGPPIPDAAASKMSDEDWLRAVERYSSNSPSPKDFLVGGAIQQSRVLEEQTKQDPNRFAKLIHRIPDDANPAYFDAILRGITDAESDIDAQTVVDACLRCHRIPGRPSGRWITRPLARTKDLPLPDEALEMIAWYATENPDPDPSQDQSNQKAYQAGQETVRYDPLFAGINSVRGTAAGTVARLIFHDEMYLNPMCK